MMINIISEDDIVYYVVNETKKRFDFNNLESLIDEFISTDSLTFDENIDESLNNYKLLLENIFNEVKKTDFISVFNSLKDDLTNEQLDEILSEIDE